MCHVVSLTLRGTVSVFVCQSNHSSRSSNRQPRDGDSSRNSGRQQQLEHMSG